MSSNRSVDPAVLAGDPFHAAGTRDRSHQECVDVMHAEEDRLGRKMTARERDVFARAFHAPAYRSRIRFLAAMGVLDEEAGEEG